MRDRATLRVALHAGTHLGSVVVWTVGIGDRIAIGYNGALKRPLVAQKAVLGYFRVEERGVRAAEEVAGEERQNGKR